MVYMSVCFINGRRRECDVVLVKDARRIDAFVQFCRAASAAELASMFFDDDHNVYYTPFAFRLQDTILNRLCYTKFEQFKVAYDLSTFLKDGMFEGDTVEESKRSETTFNSLLWRAVANDSGVNGYATHLTNDSDRVDPFEALNIDATDNLFFQLDYVLTSCLLYTSPSPRDATLSRMPSSA